MAIRSYLASMGQAGGGQGGNMQTMLGNLRQQLYGPQALQQLGGGPAGGGAMQPQQPGLGANGLPPRLQALAARDPAAAQARFAQFQAGQLPGQQGGTASGLQGTEQGSSPGAAGNVGDALQAANGGGLQAGRPMQGPGYVGMEFGPQDPNFWTPERMANAQPMPMPTVDLGAPGGSRQGQINDFIRSQVGLPNPGSAGATASTLPTTMTAAPPQNLKPTFQGAAGPEVRQPANPSTTAPAVGAALKPAAAGVNPAALGTADFKGPNAGRLTAARQGIYNNVRQALRRPAGGR